MTAGFWLRVNSKWMPLEGVQAGVGIATDRPASDFTSLGGRRYVSRAKRGPREWSLDFSHATPEAVRLLALAAQGQAGDVMLLDLSATRENMLDPLVCVGSDSAYPLIDCSDLPLRSVSPGSAVTETKEVRLSTIVTLDASTPDAAGSKTTFSLRSSPAIEAILKVEVPADPTGRTLTGASLVVAQQGASPSSATVNAYAMSNAWVPSKFGPTWNNAPSAGSLVGTVTGPLVDSDQRIIPLSGVTAFRGSTMSLRLRTTSTTRMSLYPLDFNPYWPDYVYPRLVLTYDVAAASSAFTHRVRGNIAHRLSAYTDVASGAAAFSYDAGAGATVVNAPTGSGPRPVIVDFTPPTDGVLTVSVPSATAGKVSGFRLTEGAPLGPWVPGQKTPCRVSIPDPEQTLNYLLNGQQGRSDYRVTLREVG